MAKNEAKIRFTAETGELNSEIKKSNSEMSKLRAELKLNETQMKTTGATVEALEEKHRILQGQLAASESKTQALSQKVDKAAAIFGENSDEVNKLRTQLLSAQTAEEKIRQAIFNCNDELEKQKSAAKQAESANEKLTNTIEEQQSELNQLKNDYANAVLEHGKYSKEARTLAKEIDSLSDELNANKKKMAEVENAADKLDNSLDNIDETAEKVSEGFTVMKGAMADLVADGIEKVTGSLAEIGIGAFTMSNDIDKATNTFIAKTGESADRAGEFEDAMTSIYNGNYGESFDDIADAMATVKTAMGDIGTAELENLTTQALVLRDTFDMDVNESIRAVNSMMDQFGITADEAYSLIAQGAQNGLNQNGDLLDTVNEYSVQFKNAGYSAEDMFNMLANGVDAGTWSVDKLGDAVKEFNIRASDGTVSDAIKENAEAFGLTKQEAETLASEVSTGSVGAYQKLADKLREVDDDTQRYQLGVSMFGTMWEDLGEDAVLALLDTQGEISTTNDALNEINSVKYDDLGSAFEGIKRNLETSVAEPIKNEVMPAVNEFVEDVDWQGVGQTIGEVMGVVVDVFFSLVEGVKEATQWMNEHKGVLAAVATAIGIVATAIGAYNVVQGIKAAMDAAQVTTIWGLVAAHWAQATAAMAAIAPYVLVVAAIAAVIAIIVLCVKYWDEIVAAVKKCWESICETLSVWGEWINTNVIQPIGKFFSGLWDGIVTAATTAWDGVTAFFSGVAEWFNTNVIQPIINFFKGLWDGIKSIWDGICNAVQTAWDFICNLVSVGVQLIGSIISGAIQIITLPFRFIWENCKEYVFAAWEWIKKAVSTAINTVKNVITTVMNAVKTFFSNVWNGIKSVFTTVWNAIVNFITPIVNKIKSVITTVFTAVKNTISTIFNAVKSVITTVWNKIVSVVTTVVNKVKSTITTVFNAIKNTVTTVWNAIKTVISNVINGIKNTISSVWNSIKSTASSIWNGIKNTISNVWNGIKSGVSNAINGVKNTVSNVFNSVKSTVSRVWNNIKTSITKPIEEAKNKVKAVIDAIKGFFSNLKLKFPSIKMPHFKITGKFSLDPPSVPKLGIEWYKDGGIMMKPTIFGVNGNSLMAGGEAGPEAILPIDRLEGYISGAIEKAQNVVNLQVLANAIEDLANRPVSLNINGRQFALATAGDGDSVNGLRSTFKSRGLVLD